MKNWKTTLFGALGGLPLIIQGILSGDWALVGSGVGVCLAGIFAKDSNVTGRTVNQ